MLSFSSGCAARRGGRRQCRRTRTTAAASSLPDASPFIFFFGAIAGRAARRTGRGGEAARARRALAENTAGTGGLPRQWGRAHSCQGCSHTPHTASCTHPLRTQPNNASAFAPLPPPTSSTILRRSNGPQANTQTAHPPQNHAIGTSTPDRAARLGSGRKQASNQASKRGREPAGGERA